MAFGKKKKKYRKPRKMYEQSRINEENRIIKEYGLKNKREIWKAEFAINKIRGQAKRLIIAEPEEQKVFFEKLNRMGFDVKTTADVLGLTQEDYLKRRLQSILVKKKLASTPKLARQMIVHKHVAIDGKVVNAPSYIVKRDEEERISIVRPAKLPEKKSGIKKIEEKR